MFNLWLWNNVEELEKSIKNTICLICINKFFLLSRSLIIDAMLRNNSTNIDFGLLVIFCKWVASKILLIMLEI